MNDADQLALHVALQHYSDAQASDSEQLYGEALHLVEWVTEKIAEVASLRGQLYALQVRTATASEPAPVPPPEPSTPSPRPRTRKKMTDEERRAWEAARKREQRASRSSATNQCDNGATSSATNGGTKSGTSWDKQKGSQTLQKAEEKRNLSDFRAVVAEIEVVEKRESSEARAHESGTISATNPGTNPGTNGGTAGRGTGWDSGTTDVSRRDALRVQRRFADALNVTWDTHSWLSELQRIATKPEPELARVLENLKADPWVRDNRGVVTPGHVIKHWDRYVQPPKGKVVKPVDEAPVLRRFVDHDMDARMYRELAAEEREKAKRLKGAANG